MRKSVFALVNVGLAAAVALGAAGVASADSEGPTGVDAGYFSLGEGQPHGGYMVFSDCPGDADALRDAVAGELGDIPTPNDGSAWSVNRYELVEGDNWTGTQIATFNWAFDASEDVAATDIYDAVRGACESVPAGDDADELPGYAPDDVVQEHADGTVTPVAEPYNMFRLVER